MKYAHILTLAIATLANVAPSFSMDNAAKHEAAQHRASWLITDPQDYFYKLLSEMSYEPTIQNAMRVQGSGQLAKFAKEINQYDTPKIHPIIHGKELIIISNTGHLVLWGVPSYPENDTTPSIKGLEVMDNEIEEVENYIEEMSECIKSDFCNNPSDKTEEFMKSYKKEAPKIFADIRKKFHEQNKGARKIGSKRLIIPELMPSTMQAPIPTHNDKTETILFWRMSTQDGLEGYVSSGSLIPLKQEQSQQ